MYADPSQIRATVIRVRLSEAETELLDAIVKYTGQQKSTLLRDLFMSGAQKVLAGESDIGVSGRLFEAPESAAVGQR